MPDGSIDPDAPPPAADPSAAPLSGADAGLSAVGMDAPLHFALKDINGVEVKLASFKGKVIIVNFWATWCGPCRAEIPSLVELQTQYGAEGKDVVILGISVDDPIEKLKPYAAQMKMNYPVLVGNGLIQAYDVSKPSAPVKVPPFTTPGGALRAALSGTTVYVADGRDGLQIVDFSDRSAPKIVGKYEPAGTAREVAVAGDLIDHRRQPG